MQVKHFIMNLFHILDTHLKVNSKETFLVIYKQR